MDIIVFAVLATLVLGAPQGYLLALAVGVVVAVARSRGTLRDRAWSLLGMGYLQASAAFSLLSLVLDDWQSVAIVWLIAAFLVDAWRVRGATTDRDRWALIARFVAALTGFALALLLINWVTTPAIAWFAAVALLAVGVGVVALRWPTLPWFAAKQSRGRIVGLAANLAICGLIIAASVS